MSQQLSSYEIFCSVAEYGNFSRASEHLFISQPAISKSIANLEKQLGVRLFTRNSRGVSLTPQGEHLYQHVSRALGEIASAEDTIRRSAQVGGGTLRIGVSTTLCKYILIPYLQKFIQEYPHIRISVFCQPTDQTLSQVADGSIDLGLVGESRRIAGLSYFPCKKVHDAFVATESYLEHLSLLDIPPEEYLTRGSVMLLDRDNISRQYIDEYLLTNQITFEDTLEISSMDLLIDLARIGIGIACVIADFIEKDLADGMLLSLPLPVPIAPRLISFVKKEHSQENPALEKFGSAFGLF